MSLPFSKKTKPNQSHEPFFALQLSPDIVRCAIWSIYNDKPQVLSIGGVHKWDSLSIESLVNAADSTISESLGRYDQSGNSQPQKVIFGLPSDWVSGESITPSRLQFVRTLSQKLDLKPVGFVVTSDAMVKHINYLEGVPPTVILLGFWPRMLELTVVKLGKVEGTFLINRSDNPVDDVIEGLHRFGHLDMLPSRMLLYDSGSDLEEIRQMLLSHPWQAPQKRLPFVHFPKIENLSSDFSIRSISLSGGGEVAHALGLIPDEVATEQPTQSNSHDEETVSSSPDHEALGFTEHAPVQNEVYIPISQPKQSPNPAKFHLSKFPKISFPIQKKLLLFVLLGLTLAFICLFLAYWFLPTAKVTVTVDTKSVSDTFTLFADTKITAIDTSKISLPATFSEIVVSQEESISTTGSKTIGDKATATITIFNGTDGPYKFNSGTTLTSPSGLKYVTTETVTVASASGVVPNLQYGKASTKAQASAIGGEYNIDANTTFRVANFSQKDIAAQNETAFSGGSSQKVKAVSKDDISKLRSSLGETLKAKVKTDLEAKLASEQALIEESLIITTESESFDHKQDEASDTLKLSLSLKGSGLVVSQNDLTSLVNAQLSSKVEPGFAPVGDPTTKITFKKLDKNIAEFEVQASTSLQPKIDAFTVIANITGKSTEAAKDYLSRLPSVTKVDFVISPVMPRFLVSLPRVQKNINLEVVPVK